MSYDILWYDERGSVRMVERGREILIVERVRNPYRQQDYWGATDVLAYCAIDFAMFSTAPFH